MPSACAPRPDWVDCVCALFPGTGDWPCARCVLVSKFSDLSGLSGLVVKLRNSMASAPLSNHIITSPNFQIIKSTCLLHAHPGLTGSTAFATCFRVRMIGLSHDVYLVTRLSVLSGLSGLVVKQRCFIKEAEKMVAEQEPVPL